MPTPHLKLVCYFYHRPADRITCIQFHNVQMRIHYSFRLGILSLFNQEWDPHLIGTVRVCYSCTVRTICSPVMIEIKYTSISWSNLEGFISIRLQASLSWIDVTARSMSEWVWKVNRPDNLIISQNEGGHSEWTSWASAMSMASICENDRPEPNNTISATLRRKYLQPGTVVDVAKERYEYINHKNTTPYHPVATFMIASTFWGFRRVLSRAPKGGFPCMLFAHQTLVGIRTIVDEI